MDAEIQFFMTSTDETDFLAFAQKHLDRVTSSKEGAQFTIGDCELQFTSSVIDDNSMFAGKLEIRLDDPDFNYEDIERAKSVYRKLRNWIKKKYWSRLAYLHKNKKDKLTPSRVHWLGPDAKRWKEADSENHILKLSRTSWMVFEIGV